jgi:hypothetical protein
VLGLDALQRIHGVAGVLAAHADDIIAQLAGEAETRIASAALLRLVSVEGTRRPVLREELVAAFPDRAAAERVVEHLLRGRLLILVAARRTGLAPSWRTTQLAQRWDRLRAWQVEDAGPPPLPRERVAGGAALERARARSQPALVGRDPRRCGSLAARLHRRRRRALSATSSTPRWRRRRAGGASSGRWSCGRSRWAPRARAPR